MLAKMIKAPSLKSSFVQQIPELAQVSWTSHPSRGAMVITCLWWNTSSISAAISPETTRTTMMLTAGLSQLGRLSEHSANAFSASALSPLLLSVLST